MRVKPLFYVEVLEEGGAERRVGHLARGLNGGRFQTAVAYSRSWGAVGDRLRLAGIPAPARPRAAFSPALASAPASGGASRLSFGLEPLLFRKQAAIGGLARANRARLPPVL